MKNNLEGVNRLTDDDFKTYHENLGSFSSIDVTKSQRYEGSMWEWKASYSIYGLECCIFKVKPFKEVTKDGILSTNEVYFELFCRLSYYNLQHSCISFKIQNDEAFLASPDCCINLNREFEYSKKKLKKSIIGSDYVMETRAYHYSSGTIRGLLVLEEVRKIGDNEKPRKVTVEGPSHHPIGALHNMFEQVMKTEIWKPTMLCPNLSNIERQLLRRQQPEREDGDVGFPPPRGHGGKSKRAVVIDSGGSVIGNGNCNVVIGDMIIYK
ncbi:uncharacterized protein LOC131636659 [Vicia villosa]|uniref:uncharacterized protein LOC131636659 n=1 Tax=Vicia villosa TaxID=3911 RepID=UPI00273AE719|nr:uncharacterized protein LOC131636659 [Vicia villosa]